VKVYGNAKAKAKSKASQLKGQCKPSQRPKQVKGLENSRLVPRFLNVTISGTLESSY
jgi:hypothetical protein